VRSGPAGPRPTTTTRPVTGRRRAGPGRAHLDQPALQDLHLAPAGVHRHLGRLDAELDDLLQPLLVGEVAGEVLAEVLAEAGEDGEALRAGELLVELLEDLLELGLVGLAEQLALHAGLGQVDLAALGPATGIGQHQAGLVRHDPVREHEGHQAARPATLLTQALHADGLQHRRVRGPPLDLGLEVGVRELVVADHRGRRAADGGSPQLAVAGACPAEEPEDGEQEQEGGSGAHGGRC
jgi:hypothetical protein